MTVRVLCLHDENSTATSFYHSLQSLEERLFTRHDIELVFISAPFETTIRKPASSTGIRNSSISSSSSSSSWYTRNPQNGCITGLDASILHIRQIWSQSIVSKPFSGILGVGQGAALASILPLLRWDDTTTANTTNTNSKSNTVDDDPTMINDTTTCSIDNSKMLHGLKFCIFINGWDIISTDSVGTTTTSTTSNDHTHDDTITNTTTTTTATTTTLDTNNENNTNHDDYHDDNETPPYEESKFVHTLHIFSPNDKNARILHQRYNSGEYYHYSPTISRDDTIHIGYKKHQKMFHSNVLNILGKYLVSQKKQMIQTQWELYNKTYKNDTNIITSSDSIQTLEDDESKDICIPNTTEFNHDVLISTPLSCSSKQQQPQSSSESLSSLGVLNPKQLQIMIEKVQRELSIVEQQSQELIHTSITSNPPKALIAVITPDSHTLKDGAVGTGSDRNIGHVIHGWKGEKNAFRSKEFKESGGAPYPKP